MKKQKMPIITFSEDIFPELRKVLGMKNLKCEYCRKKITKKNIGGILRPKIIICKNSLCLIKAINRNLL